jgi:hypothetical protein
VCALSACFVLTSSEKEMLHLCVCVCGGRGEREREEMEREVGWDVRPGREERI